MLLAESTRLLSLFGVVISGTLVLETRLETQELLRSIRSAILIMSIGEFKSRVPSSERSDPG
jgi:hypothetical protein